MIDSPEATAPTRMRRAEKAQPRVDTGALFDSEYPRLRTLAVAMLGDPGLAEEVAMDAFVKAFSSPGRLDRVDWPAGYLRTIVMNLCRSKIRRIRMEQSLNALVLRRGTADAPGWTQGDSDTRLDVWTALRRLPPRQRACVVLRYLDDMPDAEVAETLGCSIGTVKAQLHRARNALADALQARQKGGPE